MCISSIYILFEAVAVFNKLNITAYTYAHKWILYARKHNVLLMSEVYEWSVPSAGTHEYLITVSLWLKHLQNTHKWNDASERCRLYVNYYVAMCPLVIFAHMTSCLMVVD